MVGAGESGSNGTVEPRSGLPQAAIREQLDRILASPEFHATDQLRDFLRFIVNEKLAGRSNRLDGPTIAVAVFGRGDDFDAANDPVVRTRAGQLRRSLERYYLTAGRHDPILIDVPKGRYVPRFSARSIIPDAPATPGATMGNGTPGAPEPGLPSVAVLPFAPMTNGDDVLPLATGLTEELATELTRFQDIVVISCHAARQPPGFPTDPVEVGRRVGARFVLDGSVRHDAATLKVSAHVVDTTTGEQIWAEAFSHGLEASHFIATQEEIAAKVVATVAGEFGIIARRMASESRRKAPAELQTYEAMLRYYEHQVSPSPESARACFAALEAASAREPEYGPLWSALATLHCQMYTFDVVGFDRALETALEHARKGVFLEPGSQLGRLILAYASHLTDDAESFREESTIAVSLNPNSPYVVGSVGYLHTLRGEVDRGRPLLDWAISRNPCHPTWFRAGWVIDHLLHGDYEQGLAETQSHHPFIDFWDDVLIAAMLGRLGREVEARPHVAAVQARKPDFSSRARELIERSLKIPDLVDELVAGLHRVGLADESIQWNARNIVSRLGRRER